MTQLLDCTLRDGGYYNNWEFDLDLVNDYLQAMDKLKIDFVEIGFRSLKKDGFKGGFAYSTDEFLKSLKIPKGLSGKIGVMINGSEISDQNTQIANLKKLFNPKKQSPISLVRIACHSYEFKNCLKAAKWLKKQGYIVGFNIMQISELSLNEITNLAKSANSFPIDVLYFADSLGCLNKEKIIKITEAFRIGWQGELGIHTHDNMGEAIANCKQSIKLEINWIDCTVTGMGRGPGNAQTEYLILSLKDKYKGNNQDHIIKLFKLIQKYFKPMQNKYGWGTNILYYLSGKFRIHPTYVQEMIQDNRYTTEDILAVIDHLKIEGGKKFSLNTLQSARNFYSSKPIGKWQPQNLIKGKKVLILGAGPSIKKYKTEIEQFIKHTQPYVIALNTQSIIKQDFVDSCAVCHPLRLLTDCDEHNILTQPLITPFSMLAKNIKKKLSKKKILDFGVVRVNDGFKFYKNYCELPTSLVIGYALAIANSGKAKSIFLAGFDGYGEEDTRTREMSEIFKLYKETKNSIPVNSVTPTIYGINIQSIYSFLS
jgi:4-hydroxy 2-oxovalerate aldolase